MDDERKRLSEAVERQLRDAASLYEDDDDEDDDEPIEEVGPRLDLSALPLRPATQIKRKEDSLRPTSIDEIIGAERVKASLQVAINSAKRRNRTLDHVMITGPAGVGKTTLASVIAGEMGHTLYIDTGPNLTHERLVAHVSNIINTDPVHGTGESRGKPIVLFVDEIHRLPRDARAYLLPLLEDFNFAGTHIPAFTLVGATTDPSALEHPLRERFGIDYALDYYTDAEVLQIVERSFQLVWKLEIDQYQKRMKSRATKRALQSLANRAHGVPRVANKLLWRIYDYALDQLPHDRPLSDAPLNMEIVTEAMKAHGIDANGLTTLERKLMVVMLDRYNNRPVGMKPLASTIGTSAANLEDVVEPNLVRLGYMNRERLGRQLTEKGIVAATIEMAGKTKY